MNRDEAIKFLQAELGEYASPQHTFYVVYQWCGKEFMAPAQKVPAGAVVRGHIGFRLWDATRESDAIRVALINLDHMKITDAQGERQVAGRWEEDMEADEAGWREATKWLVEAVFEDLSEPGATQIRLTHEDDAPSSIADIWDEEEICVWGRVRPPSED